MSVDKMLIRECLSMWMIHGNACILYQWLTIYTTAYDYRYFVCNVKLLFSLYCICSCWFFNVILFVMFGSISYECSPTAGHDYPATNKSFNFCHWSGNLHIPKCHPPHKIAWVWYHPLIVSCMSLWHIRSIYSHTYTYNDWGAGAVWSLSTSTATNT